MHIQENYVELINVPKKNRLWSTEPTLQYTKKKERRQGVYGVYN